MAAWATARSKGPKARRAEQATNSQQHGVNGKKAGPSRDHDLRMDEDNDDNDSDGTGRRTPPRPPVEPLLPSELSESLRNYRVDQQLPPDDRDIVAVRTSLAVMQIQRQRLREQMRELASVAERSQQEPGALLDEIRAGTFVPKGEHGTRLLGELRRLDPDFAAPRRPTGRRRGFDFATAERAGARAEGSGSDDEDEDEDEDEQEDEQDDPESHSDFGRWPSPLPAARAPRIEWTKYRIAGEPLERLHAEQRAAEPTSAAPLRGGGVSAAPRDLFNPRDYRTSGNPDLLMQDAPLSAATAAAATTQTTLPAASGQSQQQASAGATDGVGATGVDLNANGKRPNNDAGGADGDEAPEGASTPGRPAGGASTPRKAKARPRKSGLRK